VKRGPRCVGISGGAGGALVFSVAASPPGTDRGSTSNNELLASVSNLMGIPAKSFGTGYPGTLAGLG
jgi:hypothetical protein